MKRITNEKHRLSVLDLKKYPRLKYGVKLWLRLAAIEDILSNENGEYDIDLIAEIVKAKREERCFISGVSLGDEVYYIPKFNGNPCGGVRTGHVQAVSFTKAGKRIKIREYHAHNQDFMIGKTVFLTREAAEQALKEYKDGRRD